MTTAKQEKYEAMIDRLANSVEAKLNAISAAQDADKAAGGPGFRPTGTSTPDIVAQVCVHHNLKIASDVECEVLVRREARKAAAAIS